jgi:hypothetical protein
MWRHSDERAIHETGRRAGGAVSHVAVGVRQPRWLDAVDRIQRPYVLMVIWGLAIGLAAAFVLHATVPHEWPVYQTRAVGMRASLAVLEEGGPLLAGRLGPHGAYYAVALGDAPGAFVYFPLLGHLFGGVDPVVVMSYFYVAVVALLAAVYPTIFYKLVGSRLAGLAAPLMLVLSIRAMGPIDIYWIPAWGMLALLPLLYLAARDWPRLGLVALVAIVLAAGWISSIRSNAGLGIVAAAGIVILLRRWRWWRVLPALALIAVTYMSSSVFIFTAIREHRDQRLGVKAMPDDLITQHPLWSTAYIGLGYLHNRYGIRYGNSAFEVRVHQAAVPGTPVASPQAETLIRRAYFSFVRMHPLEAIRQYGAKALVTIADTGPYLLVVLLTMPAMLLLGSGRRTRRLWALLTVPALLLAFLQPMLAVPGLGSYDAELFGVLASLGILGACWMLAGAEARARRSGLHFTLAEMRAVCAWHVGQRGPIGRSMRISAIAIACLSLVCLGGYFVRQSAYSWMKARPGVLVRYLGI